MRTLLKVFAVVVLLAGVVRAVSPFAGTWYGVANGLPAVTLTVQDEDGKISGTVVFYLQKRDAVDRPWRVEGGAIEALVDPRVEDGRLSFEVRRSSDAGNVKMTVEMVGADELRLGERKLIRLQ
jgi:uncharacterized lipoprotein